jgi:hemerythrin superfamily protein
VSPLSKQRSSRQTASASPTESGRHRAIALVLADHRRVERLFADVHTTEEGGCIGQILDALTAHDAAEQSALYPLAVALLGDDPVVPGALDAHSEVKAQMERLRSLEGAPLLEGVAELEALVTAHVAEEEEQLLPSLESLATPAQLDGLAARWEQAKQRVG